MSESNSNPATSGAGSLDASGSEGAAQVIEKLKREKINWQSKANDLESRLKDLEAKSVPDPSQKELVQKLQGENQALNSRLKDTEEKNTMRRKAAAVQDELLKLNLDPKFQNDALRLIDLADVLVDPETQTVVGASDAAKKVYEKFKETGFFKKSVNRPNHSAAGSRPNLGELDLKDPTITVAKVREYWKSKRP